MPTHARALRFSVLSSALSDDPRQAPRLSRGAGFEGLQFDPYAAGLRLPDLSQSGRREFRHILSAQDQQLSSLRVDLGAKGLGPGADVDQLITRLDRAMEAAAGLAAPLLCVDLGPLPAPTEKPKPKPAVTSQQAGLLILPTAAEIASITSTPSEPAVPFDAGFAAQVDSALIDVGQRADRYNCTIAFRSDLASYAALERALVAARCPWFGVDLDPVAILRDAWSSEEVFSRFGELIRHVRARDALAGADRRTRPAPIGQGSTSWEELLSQLDESGYAGWITIDSTELPARSTGAVQGLGFIKKLLG